MLFVIWLVTILGLIKYYKNNKPLNQNNMNIKKIKPADTYNALKIQFNALIRIVASKQAQIEVYEKRIKELSVERVIQLEAELASEIEMNAILTEELNLKSE